MITVFAMVCQLVVLCYGEDYVEIREKACEKRLRLQSVTGLSAADRSLGVQLVQPESTSAASGVTLLPTEHVIRYR